jgi:biliverdin reductase
MTDCSGVGDRVRVALVGTGFVARLRAQALQALPQAQLVAVAGRDLATAQAFAEPYGAIAYPDWPTLIRQAKMDLVIVCHINSSHGEVARAALEAGHHVVVEYPLALNADEAEVLLALAKARQRLLHVEHIELLGGTHRALKATLNQMGQPVYARYCTLSPKSPAPDSWTYSPEQFGFPLVGALSRLHRLIDCFGPVARVYCQNHYGGLAPKGEGLSRYATCLCIAQLTFASGLVAEVTYGKGEAVWDATRRLEVLGNQGGLSFDGDQGQITTAAGTEAIAVGSRRGLFAQDTTQVIDHLLSGQPLYCTAAASVYTLRVAIAAQQSALTEQAIALP